MKDKKGPPDNETAAERKAREKVEKAEQAAETKRTSDKKKAQAVVAKVSGTIMMLQSLLAKPNIEHVTSVVRSPVEDALSNLMAIMSSAKAVIDDEDDAMIEDDLKELTRQFQCAKRKPASRSDKTLVSSDRSLVKISMSTCCGQ